MAKLFLVEDEPNIRQELQTLLGRYGYECATTNVFTDLVEQILKSKPDLVLLDINLPECDGFHVCRKLREKADIPIIIVTCRDTEADELFSIHLGADDFVTKPYHTQILLARIESLLRRSKNESAAVIAWNGLKLNLSNATVKVGDEELELSKNELRILALLMRQHGQIVSREQMMEELWQTDSFVDDNTLTVNVNRLRKKLDGAGMLNYIKTKRGQGYLV